MKYVVFSDDRRFSKTADDKEELLELIEERLEENEDEDIEDLRVFGAKNLVEYKVKNDKFRLEEV